MATRARAEGRTFPLRCDEIDIDVVRDKPLLTLLDDSGLGTTRIVSASCDQYGEIELTVRRPFSKDTEVIRLVPRTPAVQLSLNVEFARLERANAVAASLIDLFPRYNLSRISLSVDNGRLAHIFMQDPSRNEVAILTDVTGTMVHESIMTTAMLWSDKLRRERNHATRSGSSENDDRREH